MHTYLALRSSPCSYLFVITIVSLLIVILSPNKVAVISGCTSYRMQAGILSGDALDPDSGELSSDWISTRPVRGPVTRLPIKGRAPRVCFVNAAERFLDRVPPSRLQDRQ